MLFLTFTMISSVDLAHHGVFHAKCWISVDCGTITVITLNIGTPRPAIVVVLSIKQFDFTLK